MAAVVVAAAVVMVVVVCMCVGGMGSAPSWQGGGAGDRAQCGAHGEAEGSGVLGGCLPVAGMFGQLKTGWLGCLLTFLRALPARLQALRELPPLSKRVKAFTQRWKTSLSLFSVFNLAMIGGLAWRWWGVLGLVVVVVVVVMVCHSVLGRGAEGGGGPRRGTCTRA